MPQGILELCLLAFREPRDRQSAAAVAAGVAAGARRRTHAGQGRALRSRKLRGAPPDFSGGDLIGAWAG
jgi:hypothetical protein